VSDSGQNIAGIFESVNNKFKTFAKILKEGIRPGTMTASVDLKIILPNNHSAI